VSVGKSPRGPDSTAGTCTSAWAGSPLWFRAIANSSPACCAAAAVTRARRAFRRGIRSSPGLILRPFRVRPVVRAPAGRSGSSCIRPPSAPAVRAPSAFACPAHRPRSHPFPGVACSSPGHPRACPAVPAPTRHPRRNRGPNPGLYAGVSARTVAPTPLWPARLRTTRRDRRPNPGACAAMAARTPCHTEGCPPQLGAVCRDGAWYRGGCARVAARSGVPTGMAASRVKQPEIRRIRPPVAGSRNVAPEWQALPVPRCSRGDFRRGYATPRTARTFIRTSEIVTRSGACCEGRRVS